MKIFDFTFMPSSELIPIIEASYYHYTNEKISKKSIKNLKKRSAGFLCVYHVLLGKYCRENHYQLNYKYHKLINRLCIFMFKCGFTTEVNVGNGLYLVHTGGLSINPNSRIGKNLTIRHNTTIGNDGKSNKNCPIIGDDVDIGAHSIVIGDISIGNNVIIGAGSVVVKSIPDNTMVAGNPARIIKRYCLQTNKWEKCNDANS